MMHQVKAPRSVFIDFPLGHQCGRPGDSELQTQILTDTLNMLVNAKGPGTMVDLDYQWDELFDWDTYLRDVKEMIEEEDAQVFELTP